MEITITSAKIIDIKEILSLEKICFSDSWGQNSFLEEIENSKNNKGFFLAATKDQKILGYIILKYTLEYGDIVRIAVLPSVRKLGVGSQMLEYTKELAIKSNIEFLNLEVRKSNKAAMDFYNKNGFVFIGERKNFYSLPKEDAILMQLDLQASYIKILHK